MVKEQIPRILLLSSECSQELEKRPEFYQTTVVFFFSFSCSPPSLYYMVPLTVWCIYCYFFKISILVYKLQEPSLQRNGNDGAKHFLVSGTTANFIDLVLMNE